MTLTHVAILTFDGFNEVDSLIAFALVNRVEQLSRALKHITPFLATGYAA